MKYRKDEEIYKRTKRARETNNKKGKDRRKATKKRAKTCTRFDQGVNTKNPKLHSGSKPAPNYRNNGTHIYEMNDQLVHEIHTPNNYEGVYIYAHTHTYTNTHLPLVGPS